MVFGIYSRVRPVCQTCGAPAVEIFPKQWKCISTACQQSIAPTCRCGAKKVLLEGGIWACIYCDIFHETLEFVYINHCYHCYADIDSRYCLKSVVPNAGYHCSYCGRDLRGGIVLLRRVA